MPTLKSSTTPAVAKTTDSTIEDIPIQSIRRDGGTQPRARLDDEAVDNYVQSLNEGAQFPPITLFYDGDNYWLADGFHRVKAHENAGQKSIQSEVRTGTRRDAVLFCVGANATHGLRRSNADKRRAVETLLNDPEWRKWSNSEIASRSNVSHPYVGQIRRELFGDTAKALDNEINGLPDSEPRLAQRNGTTYVVKTSNLGPKSSSNKSTKRQRKIQELDDWTPQPVIVKPKKVINGDVWKLGIRHRIYCGDESSLKFQALLPEQIALLLIFTTTPEGWLPNVPNKAKNAIAFYTSFGEDLHLATIRDVASSSIKGTTDADDAIVMLGLPDPSLFLLMEEMECHCYCAEPDPKRCTEALTAWSTTGQASEKL